MKKSVVVFNPLKKIMVRGISLYTKEMIDFFSNEGMVVKEVVMPDIVKRFPRPLQIISFILYQQVVFPVILFKEKPTFAFDAYNSYSLLGALFYKYIYVIHDFIPFNRNFWWARPGAVYQRVLQKISPALGKLQLCYITEDVAKEGERYINKNYKVLPNIVVPLDVNENDTREVLNIYESDFELSEGGVVLSTISGSGINKDFEGLCELLSSLGIPVKLFAFGFSDAKREKIGDNVEVIKPGFKTSGFICDVIRRSDLFIFHSQKEGFGRPVVEALFEGKKVVCAGGCPVINSVTEKAMNNVYVYETKSEFKGAFERAISELVVDVSMDEIMKYGRKDVIRIFSEF